MKKSILLVAILVIVLAFSMVLIACDDNSTDGTGNTDAEIMAIYDTYVAYAQENGTTPLSYEEWLATIKGEKGEKGEKDSNYQHHCNKAGNDVHSSTCGADYDSLPYRFRSECVFILALTVFTAGNRGAGFYYRVNVIYEVIKPLKRGGFKPFCVVVKEHEILVRALVCPKHEYSRFSVKLH